MGTVKSKNDNYTFIPKNEHDNIVNYYKNKINKNE